MTAKHLAAFVATLGFALGLAGSIAAALITWEFEGVVRYANMGTSSALASSVGVSVGAPVSGSVTYESTTPDRSSIGNGLYHGAVWGFEIEIGSYAVEFARSSHATFFVDPRPRTGAEYGHEWAQGAASLTPSFLAALS